MLLILECKADEKLAMTLGVSRKSIRHQNDKGNVCNFLDKHTNVMGLIDEDPNSAQPRYLNGARTIGSIHNVRVLQATNNNKIIVLLPRLEDWIIFICSLSKVNPDDFFLSSSPNQLHKEINYKLDQMENLLKELLTRKNPALNHLKSLLHIVGH